MPISFLDIFIILIYLFVMLGVGFFLGRKESSEGFFVNNRKTKTFLLVFTAVSTSVGGGTVIGMASAAYSSGISLGLSFATLSVVGWILVAWLAPRIKSFGDKTGAYTFGDFFAARYSSATRKIGSIVILLSYLTFTAIQFVALAKMTEVIGGINFEIALVAAALTAIAYTALAGLKGDIYTDAIQFFVMFPVFVFLFFASFSKIGFSQFLAGIPADYFNPFNYAGPSFFIGAIAFGFPLLLVSMEVWQRVFAAVDGKTARRAFLFSGLLKVVFISTSIIIGLLAFQLVPGINKDTAIFVLMKELLPSGILGLGFASILAVLMSTVDSMIMVGSATLTKDYYLVKYPNVDEKKKIFIGRVSALLFGLIAFFVALIFQDIVRLSVTSVQILGIFAPALLGGLIWRRSSAQAAFWSILVGFIATLILLPFKPDTAFIPAILLSIIIFVVLSLWSGRKNQEPIFRETSL